MVTALPFAVSMLEQIKMDSGTGYAAFDLVNTFSFIPIRQKVQKQLKFKLGSVTANISSLASHLC